MACLIVVEHDNQSFLPINNHLLSAAEQFSTEIHLLIVGYKCELVAKESALFANVAKVICIDGEEYAAILAEPMASLIAEYAKNYEYVLMPASTFGKNILPRASAILDVPMISDVVDIIDAETFRRPVYAGNAMQTVRARDIKKLLTIRASAFPAYITKKETPASIDVMSFDLENQLSEFVDRKLSISERPELVDAKTIVSGGRGLQSAEKFKLIEQLADVLHAAVGASRAAVDAGFISNDHQVGQTGKIVAPDLYFAIGISGAVQHLAGMKDAKIIVAINKDEDAPIFKIATYGLIGDLFELVPKLIRLLQQ